MKIAILILNYNNYEDTKECIERLTKLSIDNSRIIVIDNHSSDDSLVKLRKLSNSKSFELLSAKRNKGFAAGNNMGIKYAIKKGMDYVVILNNDFILNEDIISPMTEYLNQNRNVGVVGPSIWSQNVLINIGNKVNFRNVKYDNSISLDNASNIIDADYIVGACMVSRVEAIKKVGLLPEEYFLNFEETSWCLMFKRKGYRIECLTQFSGNHLGNGTIGKISGMQVYFLRRNIVLFVRRNADPLNKILFFLKLIPYGILQSIHAKSFLPLRSYIDGITERNRYDYLE
ncbi:MULTISPECIES: glycosyltransferase family 2 protein [Latilactobacillus]|uniref:glycosyltransferase family 2 protein n=1 Tax=Latilactobacillus TaxID=2767885 RepID=UPI000704BDE7|nr:MULTISPECIES: glycosyltransferase family 2 protein [Latilactobacillus]MDG2988976.1 glycosyltransferase family 2 protein [Latilactobacillus curvatus]UTB75664.1 hypothetical protein A4W74_02710 [Latilactobacillus curvatus]GED82512.1 rhamnosyltransferase [Latilactobacillus curvatus]